MRNLAQLNQFFTEKGFNIEIQAVNKEKGLYSGYTTFLTAKTQKDFESEKMVDVIKHYINGKKFKTQKAVTETVYELWQTNLVFIAW